MKGHADVLIVGGGVIGLTTAYFLARAGARVTLLDRGDFGQEASWAGAGILPPGNPQAAKSPFDQLRARSVAMFPEFSAELLERTGIDNGYRRCGGLEFLGHSEEADAEEWRGAGVAAEPVPDGRTLEPDLADGLGQVLHLPDLAQVRNPWHMRALVIGCQKLGVDLHPHSLPPTLVRHTDRRLALQVGQNTITPGQILIAAGAWSPALLVPLGIQLKVTPVRGQIVLLNPGRPVLQRVLLWGPRYLVSRDEGRILVGSTEEHVGFDKSTTTSAREDLLQLAYRLVPALHQAAVEKTWAGLRPGSPDGLPFLGQVPVFDNLFLAAGHFRAGIQLSLGTAQVMKELILGEELSIGWKAFAMDRNTRNR